MRVIAMSLLLLLSGSVAAAPECYLTVPGNVRMGVQRVQPKPGQAAPICFLPDAGQVVSYRVQAPDGWRIQAAGERLIVGLADKGVVEIRLTVQTDRGKTFEFALSISP